MFEDLPALSLSPEENNPSSRLRSLLELLYVAASDSEAQ